jgi:putative transferase (TIGR04331 family)
MVKRLLVTTALEETWDIKKPILFLGEWCKLYPRKTKWQNLDFELVPYHWDNRLLLQTDFILINIFYEKLLGVLTDNFNKIHGVDYSIKYWRILIGPWLGEFLQIIFDRWTMLDIAYKNYTVEKVKLISHSFIDGIPGDMNEFQKFITQDSWNELIYGEIIQFLNKTNIEWVKISVSNENSTTGKNSIYNFDLLILKFKTYSYKLGNAISGLLGNKSDYFFLTTYLPRYYEWLLQIQLNQFPKFWATKKILKLQIDSSLRKNMKIDFNTKNQFEDIAIKLIFKYIPVCYIEGYQKLSNSVSKLSWPKTPKAVFTSNRFFEDDFFKAWVAEKLESGVPLIVGQHGGNYGTSLFSFSQDHEIKIANLYYSWGWDDVSKPNIVPMFNLKMVGKKSTWNPKGKLFLVTMELPRYSYWLYSVPVASQFLNYLEDQFRFIEALPNQVKVELLARIFPRDFGWAQRERFTEKFPWLIFDDGKFSIFERMKEIRLYVSTYNATTFLESLYLNIPTIMFWDFKFWEINSDAKPYYDELISVGILHQTPDSAAMKIEEIWNDVESWWESEEIQNVRIRFCSRFSREVKEPMKLLLTSLKTIPKLPVN